jgi:hypothetical protein
MTRDIGAASGEAARAALLKTATASGTHVARETSGEPLTPAADRAIWHLNRFSKSAPGRIRTRDPLLRRSGQLVRHSA